MLIELRKLSAIAALALAGLVGCTNAQSPLSGANGALSNVNGDGIIGGEDAVGGENFTPHVVALFNAAQGSICTASILSETILLTAAHCVEGPSSNLRVVFGLDLKSTNIELRTVDTYEVTPLWPVRQNEDLNAGDMALVKFSGGMPAGFKTVRMLTDNAELSDGQTILLAGFGTSDGVARSGSGKLRYVQTTIARVDYSETELLVEQSKGKGACHGDSGGPAYIEVDGELIVIGITNRAVNDPFSQCGSQAAFASTAAWQTWIADTIVKLDAFEKPSLEAVAQ